VIKNRYTTEKPALMPMKLNLISSSRAWILKSIKAANIKPSKTTQMEKYKSFPKYF
jgi:hypothetical protein